MASNVDHRVLLFLAVVVWIYPCMSSEVQEKIICEKKRINVTCSSGTIRMIEAIYGRTVGQDFCGQKPTRNCTLSAYCYIFDRINGHSSSQRPKVSNSLMGGRDPCRGYGKYLIVKYRCGQWSAPASENFALEKPASQSSTYSRQSAFRAVDDDFRNSWRYCTHTQEQTDPWWRVDLQQRIRVTHVKIYNRNSYGERLCGFEIRVTESPDHDGTTSNRCGELKHIGEDSDDVVICRPPVTGRYVTIVIPGNNEVLTLCEVQVYGTSVLGRMNLTGARLVGSNLPYEGQLLLNGNSFCDPQWFFEDADTACQQLGYPGTSAENWRGLSIGVRDNSMRNVPEVRSFVCTGKESSLSLCLQTVDAGAVCSSQNYVKVTCQTFIRLVASDIPLQGRVEVIHKGIWGTVCNTGWSREDARVTCRELGFYDVLDHSFSSFDEATGTIWLRDLRCNGDEKSLVLCEHGKWKKNSCPYHSSDVGVNCSICAKALLKDRRKFPDDIFKASAIHSPDYAAKYGRLYSPRPWCLPDNKVNVNQFLEIHLPGIFSLSAIATVGGSLGYVTSYKLLGVVDGSGWRYATVNNQEVIPGNTNDNTQNVIRRELERSFQAQTVRFIPKTWIGIPCLRVELCGEEIPRCYPPNITVSRVTSTSARIDWNRLVVPKTGTDHYKYSVNLSRLQDNYQYSRTTEQSYQYINDLRPYRQYNFTVTAVDLEECFGDGYSSNFTTKEGGALEHTRNGTITSSSFGIRLQQPQPGFSYVQIIVVRLRDNQQPSSPPNSYSSEHISTVNASVDILKPYVTAELSGSDFDLYKDFIIGDGMNYPKLSRRRRREDGSRTRSFYNRPLLANSFYSAFQRTFRDEQTYYSSSWMKPVRTTAADPDNLNMKSSDNGTSIGIGIGVGVGVVILVVLVLLLVVFVKKRRSRLNKMDDNVNKGESDLEEMSGRANGAAYDCVTMEELSGAEDGESKTEAKKYYEEETVYANSQVNEARDPSRMVPVDEFEAYVQDMKKNKNYGFERQFKELPQGVCYPCTIAKKPENKSKNRYANMFSYDAALVVLSGDDVNTYINASFIAGVQPKSYIATQGPSERTISTFWRMVWEQESTMIVMLTNLKEQHKTKCSKYWPETSKKYGDITVTLDTKKLSPYYVVQTFLVVKDGEKRFVTHFHFTAWPDHGVPKYPTQLLAFRHCIRMNYEINGPMIVHCSAGIGRSGTFIAIDHVLERLSTLNQRSIDVFGIVQEMRKCRANMIQTIEQYILVHEAILESILCGVNEIEGYSLENTVNKLSKRNSVTKQTGFEELFQRLSNLSPVLTKEECKTATSKMNTIKNRTTEIYPADYARVTLLNKSTKNGSDYINATFVDGYKRKNAYIATENPLTSTFADFWQMIHEQKSPIIVMLNSFKEENETYPVYFPSTKTEVTKYGNLYLRLEEFNTDHTTIVRKFLLSKTSDFKNSSVVRHFQFTQWHSRGVPTNVDDVLRMIHSIEEAQRQNEQGPMVVHCSDGAGRTGAFLTLSISLERLKAEQRVDVFQCIKLIREQRPQFVESATQLQFCYEVLATYVRSFEEYSNFDLSK